MLIFWTLCLLIGLGNTQDPSVDSIAKSDAEVTASLVRYLEKYEKHLITNSELAIWIEKVRRASKLPMDKLAEKIATRLDFERYNDRRLELELEIDDRIEDLDLLIPQQVPKSRCSVYYLRQRSNLKKAKCLSNEKKVIKLRENSLSCPYDNYDDVEIRQDDVQVEAFNEEFDLAPTC
ncbi:hypothetical protein KR018_001070 [Drosophila ironensis]|nr:hypothetical protein KR018_001070 [Drosophila ironensis]